MPPPAGVVKLGLTAAPHWQLGDGPVHALAPVDALLLAWLAIEGPTPREQMASLLWPDSPAAAARNTLRQRLFRMRRAAGLDLVAGSAVLSLADGLQHDLVADSGVLSGLGSGAEAASAPLGGWLAQQRRQRAAHRRQGLLERLDALESGGDLASALPLAQDLLALDPLAEDSHRRVMRLHYLQGDRAAALLSFDRLEQQLKHEVGTRPSAETLALLATIEAAGDPLAASGLALDAVAEPAFMRQRPLPVAVLRPPRLVGRDGELALLRESWWLAPPGLALVVGEAGMGKSRLLGTLLTRLVGAAPDAHAAVLASARPGDTLVPYASFARLLRAWWPQAGTELAALAPEHRSALAPLVPEWVAAPGAAPTRASESPAAALRALFLAAAASGGQTPSLLLDDLHFADAATLALLPGLVSGSEPALRLALGSRPASPGSALDAALTALRTAAPEALIVELQPLSPAQLAELVDSLGLPQARGVELAPLLRQHSGGNPLFALETLKAALKAGLGGAAWTLATALPKPESLRQLIAQQLARLSPGAAMLARLAALAGVDFDLHLACAVLGQHALQLADPWAELEAQQVLLDDGSFAHDLVFEAVLAAVPGAIARHLHGRIAEVLEAGDTEPARLAHHWEAAGQPQRALRHWRAAAERAHRAWREDERIACLLRAADIAEAAGDRDSAFDSVARAVDAHMDVLRDDRGYALLDRLDRLAEGPHPRAIALGKRAWYLSQLPDHGQAVQVGQAALALAEAGSDRALTELIRQRLATSLSLLGRFDEALAHLDATRPWAESHLRDDDLASYHGNTAVVLDNLGRPEPALEHHRRAQAASLAIGDHSQLVTHLSNHAVNRLNAGDAGAALALAEEGQRQVAQWGLTGGSVAFLCLVQSQAARALGAWRLARQGAEHALALLEQSNPARRPMVWLHRALIELELGQHQAAMQDLQRVADVAPGLPPHLRARHATLLARWQHERGLDSRAAATEAVALAPRNGWPEVLMTAELQAAVASGDDTERTAVAARVRETAASMGLAGSVLAAAVLEAEVLHRHAADAGRTGSAIALLPSLLRHMDRTVPTLRPRAEAWLALARLHLAAGNPAAAAVAASAGRKWLLQRLADDLDGDAERESALHRVPSHRALCELAERLAAA